MTEAEAHAELSAYTLGHGNVAFIHQHVVDAWERSTTTGQQGGASTPSMVSPVIRILQ